VASTGAAVPGSQLRLYSARGNGSVERKTPGEVDGRFSFDELPLGVYSIGAFREGFEIASGNVRIDSTNPRAEIELKLQKQPVIAGQVRDHDGRPIEGAHVYLHRKDFGYGVERLTPGHGAGALADDRGVYRIHSITPGTYFASVRPPQEPSPANQVILSHSVQIYPVASRLSEARAFRLVFDDERRDVDFELGEASDSAVRILATIPDESEPCSECNLRISQRFGLLYIPIVDGRTGRRGEFTAVGLSPGSYTVVGGRSADNYSPDYVFRHDFSISEAGVGNLDVQAWAPASVSVELQYVEPPQRFQELPSDQARNFVVMPPVDERMLAPLFDLIAGVGVQVERDTPTAIIEKASPGPHFVEVSNRFSGGGYLQTLYANDRPLRRPIVEIPIRGLTRLRAVIRFDGASISGTVQGAQAKAVLVQAIRTDRPALGPRLKASTDADGSFQLRMVPPGEYSLFAYPQDSGYDFQDPATRQRYRHTRVQVVAEENGQHTVEIKRIAGE
jgi:hypothetical protein